ncbi:DUF3298 and DUF4163 domain-containing protein [Virgibacillus sp. MSJ-26]|uniref:DUF3298 and DUF4163 domain-containing protein n=1 Tax=Virgibacillus sp. MSJ-26 TaxID=2841522 RepID=UPI001C11ECC9|nr:DUF3298 and DUF4163 domain-containing protein [Virgibacillus sp. MSJ-26]MBU5467868.1 DUF3298 and DUF4163 domain-containing protein [Virgibacillus sp. MSJ-26]
MPNQTLNVLVQTRVFKQNGITIYYPEIIGLQNLHVQHKINRMIVQHAQHLINQQFKQQDVDRFAEMIGTYEVKTNQRGILSLTLSNYAIAPKHANGLTIINSLTVDVETGRVYQLKDLFKQGSDYVNVLSDIVKKQIKEREIPTLNDFTGISPNQEFYIADKSLVLYFQPLEITPHYIGSPMFPISVYELESIIDENGPLGKMIGA